MDESHRPPDTPRDEAQTSHSASLSSREAERAALKSLRDHVTRAVEEIVRLRAQNKSLARRLAEFETSSTSGVPTLDEGIDVNELKSKIAGFVSSIDAYLAENAES